MDFAGTRTARGSTVVTGFVTTAITAGKTITVTINGTDIVCRADRDLTAGVGDVVYGLRMAGQVIITGRLFTAATAPPDPETSKPPPPVKPPTVTGTLVITPVETRSYRPNFGWRTDNDDIYQGEYGNNGNHVGCAFYGNKPRSLKNATVTSASIRAKRLSGGDFAARTTTLQRIGNRTKPGGSPSIIGGTVNGPRLAVGKSDTTITIPTSWAQDLVDGNAGGLAIRDTSGTPYVRLAGHAAWSSSFILTIKWKR
jgi:hypothetical protein